MTQEQFDALKPGDGLAKGGRRYVVTAVHEGEGRLFSNVVYARLENGARKAVVDKTFTLAEVTRG
jgi:hypothetical protein